MAFGNNVYGQLGDGTTVDRFTPVHVSGITDAVAVAAGYNHSLALKSNGTVWAWGYNAYGQLGDGTTLQRVTPVQVSGLTGVVAIAGGFAHSLALKSDGTVWAWGWNVSGQLGDGTTTQRNTPVQVSGLTGVVAIAGGNAHSLALKSDGTVWAWGDGTLLGNGTTTQRNTPVQVSGLTGVVAIAGGFAHSLALKSDGTVWAWGANLRGQLGTGEEPGISKLTPVKVFNLTGVTAITGGPDHSSALKSDGTVWTWGGNLAGQLGDGTQIDKLIPVQVSGLTGVVALAGSSYHSLALKSDGTVWGWGDGSSGQLGGGDDHLTLYLTPVQVSGLTNAISIAGNGAHSLAVFTDTIPPTGTISINSGASSTMSTTIALTLSCADFGGCAQMRFSNDNSSWSSWETYAASTTWNLMEGEGSKTVYVQFKDNVGNISAVMSDTILLAGM